MARDVNNNICSSLQSMLFQLAVTEKQINYAYVSNKRKSSRMVRTYKMNKYLENDWTT